MSSLSSALYFIRDHKSDWSRTIATYLAILIYVLVTSQIYIALDASINESDIYNTSEAIGALTVGFLSDKFCRRRICLISHLIGLIILPLIFLGKASFILFVLFGFFYNPMPILRASLIDNLSHFSKIKIIALSFVVQYLPWTVYNLLSEISRTQAFRYAILLLVISFFVCFIGFFDKRDKKHIPVKKELMQRPIITKAYNKFYCTILAAIPAQLVYFFSNNLLEKYSQDALYYSILSFGSLFGALVASLYKKTPHVSVLTINYGINMVLAIIPLSSIFLYGFREEINFPLMFIIFGCLGGFGIPFVYDVILNSTFVKYRGTACGLLDAIFSISSVVNLFLVNFLNLNILWTLIIIPLCFVFSTFLQKQTE